MIWVVFQKEKKTFRKCEKFRFNKRQALFPFRKNKAYGILLHSQFHPCLHHYAEATFPILMSMVYKITKNKPCISRRWFTMWGFNLPKRCVSHLRLSVLSIFYDSHGDLLRDSTSMHISQSKEGPEVMEWMRTINTTPSLSAHISLQMK